MRERLGVTWQFISSCAGLLAKKQESLLFWERGKLLTVTDSPDARLRTHTCVRFRKKTPRTINWVIFTIIIMSWAVKAGLISRSLPA